MFNIFCLILRPLFFRFFCRFRRADSVMVYHYTLDFEPHFAGATQLSKISMLFLAYADGPFIEFRTKNFILKSGRLPLRLSGLSTRKGKTALILVALHLS